MDTFFKTIAAVIVCVILCLSIPRQGREMTVVIVIAACCMVATVAFSFLDPVFSFVDQLTSIGNLESSMVKTLLKAAGICLISEFSVTVCEESGKSSLGKAIQFLTAAVLLSMAIPFMNQLIDIVSKLLSET